MNLLWVNPPFEFDSPDIANAIVLQAVYDLVSTYGLRAPTESTSGKIMTAIRAIYDVSDHDAEKPMFKIEHDGHDGFTVDLWLHSTCKSDGDEQPGVAEYAIFSGSIVLNRGSVEIGRLYVVVDFNWPGGWMPKYNANGQMLAVRVGSDEPEPTDQELIDAYTA